MKIPKVNLVSQVYSNPSNARRAYDVTATRKANAKNLKAANRKRSKRKNRQKPALPHVAAAPSTTGRTGQSPLSPQRHDLRDNKPLEASERDKVSWGSTEST